MTVVSLRSFRSSPRRQLALCCFSWGPCVFRLICFGFPCCVGIYSLLRKQNDAPHPSPNGSGVSLFLLAHSEAVHSSPLASFDSSVSRLHEYFVLTSLSLCTAFPRIDPAFSVPRASWTIFTRRCKPGAAFRRKTVVPRFSVLSPPTRRRGRRWSASKGGRFSPSTCGSFSCAPPSSTRSGRRCHRSPKKPAETTSGTSARSSSTSRSPRCVVDCYIPSGRIVPLHTPCVAFQKQRSSTPFEPRPLYFLLGWFAFSLFHSGLFRENLWFMALLRVIRTEARHLSLNASSSVLVRPERFGSMSHRQDTQQEKQDPKHPFCAPDTKMKTTCRSFEHSFAEHMWTGVGTLCPEFFRTLALRFSVNHRQFD